MSNDRGLSGRRSVLIVSYYFPPSGGPGVQRVLKFARYLPEHGYRPVVLTVPETAAFPVRDHSLKAEIPPDALVVRSPIREFYGLYARAAGRSMSDRSGAAPPPNLVTTASAAPGRSAGWLQWIRGALFIPDGRMGWVPGGTKAGVAAARTEKADLVFASGPPFTAHWIAKRVAERCRLPLILDFRDPWTRAPFYPARPGFARALDERLERSCLLRADAVVTVNEAIRDDLLARHPTLDRAKFHVITNGWDPADFEGLDRTPAPGWVVTHTGTLPGGLPAAFPRALARLLRDDPGIADHLRVRFIGHTPPAQAERLTTAPLDRVVRIEPYRPHRESVQALLESRLLLLCIEEGPQARGILTGKLFEYLGSGVPILALVPEGEAAALVRQTGCGLVLRGDDESSILEALQTAVGAFRAGERPFGAAIAGTAQVYARPVLTASLARLFDGILSRRDLARRDLRV